MDISEGFSEDIDLAVSAAEKAFPQWKKMNGTARMRLINKLADIIEREAKSLALLESTNNGSPLVTQNAVIGSLADEFRYYAGWIDKLDGRTIPTDSSFAYTVREPIGICGIIIPWNLPLWALTVKLAPCLAMGNTCVIKPSEKTPLTALRFAELCVEAGIPAGVINIVNGFGVSCGSHLALHMKVRKIAFTGSTMVGKMMMEASAKSNLKRIQLELGGKSAITIDKDVDIKEAAQIASTAIFSNNGQLCTAGSRCFVHADIYDEFLAALVEVVKKIKVGDPTECGMGPIVDEVQCKRVMEYIKIGKDQGAKLLLGGNRVDGKGYFIEPTIFSDVDDDMRISKEEIFGPVLSVFKYDNHDSVIERINDSEYGLAGCIVSRNIDTCMKFTRQVNTGHFWVNTYHAVYRNVEFGGFKQSGMFIYSI